MSSVAWAPSSSQVVASASSSHFANKEGAVP